jgi:hypothetical protein
VWPVNKGCLLLLGIWSYLWYIQGSVYAQFSRFFFFIWDLWDWTLFVTRTVRKLHGQCWWNMTNIDKICKTTNFVKIMSHFIEMQIFIINKAQIVLILSHAKKAWINTQSNSWRYPTSDAIRRLILFKNCLDYILLSLPNFHFSEFSAPIEHKWDSYLDHGIIFFYTVVLEIQQFATISRTVSRRSLSIKSWTLIFL